MTSVYGDRFETQEILGHGGLGTVYRALDRETGQTVALKVLRPEIIASDPSIITRFQREAELLRELDHPNIVRAIASGMDDDTHYIVMEYLEGGTLRELLRKQKQIAVPRVLEIGIDVADALTRAHRMNVVHRDIKPANIIFDAANTPHLTDFGIARLGEETRLTQVGDILGSYNYISPEACGGLAIDHRTDIWSFGVTLFEMLAGRPPFIGDSPGAVVNGIMHQPIPLVSQYRPDTPIQLVTLIKMMLERDPAKRISSMRLVGAELENIIRTLYTPTDSFPVTMAQQSRFDTTGSTPVVKPENTSSAAPVRRFSWPILAAALGIMVVAMVLIGVRMFNDASDDGDEPSAPAITAVEPVPEGKLMVLVAALEPLDSNNTNMSRFISDNLTRTFERSVAYLDVEVRSYPGIITSSKMAGEVADFNDAAIIVWGNFSDDLATVTVEYGDSDVFPHIYIDRKLLEDTLDVTVELPAARQDVLSRFVISDLAVLHSANGQVFDAGKALVALGDLDHDSHGRVIGRTVASEFHYYFDNLANDVDEAIDAANRALAIDPANPVLYHFRGLAYQKAGEFDLGDQDLETAARISQHNWYASQIVRAANAILNGDYQNGIQIIDPLMGRNPDDWFIAFVRGNLHYIQGDLQLAETDYKESIDRGPTSNLPYISLAQLMVRFGEIDAATTYFNTAIENFSDPDLMNRILEATYGEKGEGLEAYTLALSGYGSFVAGQYADVVNSVERAIMLTPENADLYLLKGVAECSLRKYTDAEATYTEGIEHDPDFTMFYLLRAEVRNRQGDLNGAFDDLRTASQSAVFESMEAYIQQGMSGELSCRDFLIRSSTSTSLGGGS